MASLPESISPKLKGLAVLYIEKSDRSAQLARKASFFFGTQHDHLNATWDGAYRSAGQNYFNERLTAKAFRPINGDVSIASRKPNNPVPLGRQIVRSFTGLLVGEGREPSVHVWGDKDTQDYIRAVFKKARVWETMERSRNMCGSQGSSMILCGLSKGLPFTQLLDPKNAWVVEWDEDVPYWRPKTVVEQVKVSREEIDPDSGKLMSVEYWQTRAWTTEGTVVYKDVRCDRYKDGDPLPLDDFIPHKLGVCPVIWYQNTSNSDSPDGDCDYETLYENLDGLDRLSSQVHKGTTANVDPTLVIREDQRLRGRARIIEKGKVVGVPSDGDAKYLEMQGTSIKTAQDQLDREKNEILQTANCVILDQSYSGALQSSESMQMLFRSMESRAGVYRKCLADVLEQLAELWCVFAKKYGIAVDKFGEFDKDTTKIRLPPKREREEDDEAGTKPHKLGSGGTFSLKWPPLFQPTPAQIASIAAALSTATGAKQYFSSRSASRQFAAYVGTESEEEIALVEEEKEEAKSEMLEAEERMLEHSNPGDPPGSGDDEPEPTSAKELKSDKPKTKDDITKPAAKAKKGKRGPEKPG